MPPRRIEQLPLPDRHTRGPVDVYLSPGHEGEDVLGDLFELPAVLEGLPGRSTRQPGRTTLWAWQPSWHEGPGLVVRQYAHGGLLGPLLGTTFARRRRMVNEMRVALYARGRGVQTARPVALRVERVRGAFVAAHYVTERVADAVNLLEFLQDLPASAALSAGWRGELASATARCIAGMHDAGIVHADLNLQNLLVRDPFGEPSVVVVDFDKARLLARVPLRLRMKNLVRLDRSIVKWAAARRNVCTIDRLRMLRSYLARYPQWQSDWRQIGRLYGSRHAWHCLHRQPDAKEKPPT